MSIAIVIDESAAGSPRFAGAAHAGFIAYVGKRAVPVVVIQNIFPVVGDIKIFPSVVVVVAHTNALPPSGVRQAGLVRGVAERPVMVVAIQVIGGAFPDGKSFKLRAVDNKDVRPAIVVEIKDGNARTGSLNDVFLGGLAAKNIHHRKAGFLCHVREVRQRFSWLRSLKSGTIHRDKQRKRQEGGEACSQDQGERAPMRRNS